MANPGEWSIAGSEKGLERPETWDNVLGSSTCILGNQDLVGQTIDVYWAHMATYFKRKGLEPNNLILFLKNSPEDEEGATSPFPRYRFLVKHYSYLVPDQGGYVNSYRFPRELPPGLGEDK